MATSRARVEANRRNAKKSTGPRTLEGKERSRANSLQHGLTAKVLRTAEEIRALGEPTPPPPGRLGASPLDRSWIAKEIKLLSLRIERAGVMEMRLRDRSALRAADLWDVDRRFEAETIGVEIHQSPADVAAALEKTPQGCRWMIERWAMLARAADRDGGWSPQHVEIVFDLLGTPLDLRSGPVTELIDTEGRISEVVKNLGDFARKNVDRLLYTQELLAEADAFDQDTARAGLAFDLGAEGHRLIRYEAELQRRLRWFHDLLDQMPEEESEPGPASPKPRPVEMVVGPEPVSGPGVDEVDEVNDEPTIAVALTPPPASRRDRRADRVERRKLAAERKLARRLE